MLYMYIIMCGSKGDRMQTVPAALELVRSQWKEA